VANKIDFKDTLLLSRMGVLIKQTDVSLLFYLFYTATVYIRNLKPAIQVWVRLRKGGHSLSR